MVVDQERVKADFEVLKSMRVEILVGTAKHNLRDHTTLHSWHAIAGALAEQIRDST